MPERIAFGRCFLPERTFAARRTLYAAWGNCGRGCLITCTPVAASREVLLGKEELQKEVLLGKEELQKEVLLGKEELQKEVLLGKEELQKEVLLGKEELQKEVLLGKEDLQNERLSHFAGTFHRRG